MNLTQISRAADRLSWRRVPELMLEYYEKSAGVAELIRAIVPELPKLMPGYGHVYWNPDTKQIWVVSGDSDGAEVTDPWQTELSQVTGVDSVRIEAEYSPLGKEDKHPGPWVKIAGTSTPSTPLGSLGEYLNYFPNRLNKHIPGLQSPLGAALTSGLIGAGLGYAGGAVAETMLPETWHRGRLRRTLALLGGLGGAAPALAWGAANLHNGKSVLDGWPLDDGPHPPAAEVPIGYVKPDEARFNRKLASLEYHSETGVTDQPLINVDAFNRVIWGDPRVTNVLSPVMLAATSGLVTGAATLAGGGRQAKLISPMDVGRMAAGMGSGYLAGELVGKALGLLTGMPQATQDRLKQTGMFAGVVANMVPLAFAGAT